MKPQRILGFALTVGFLAPLAQAAPARGPEQAHYEVPAPAAANDRRADPPPQAAPERHDPYLPPRGDSGRSAPPDRDDHQHDVSPPIYNVVQAPATDDSQDTTPVYDDPSDATTDDSCGDASATPAHYSMDDLVNAMQDLDSSY